ncbi:WD40-repeat-containing domain protein [Halteromyces radiatus]|uniref:WD40-repeat-containing domain protein n=1 Tax=Halteromyces radiatus TaxID=101107 RepID=UPI0022207F30|nr:WD40-repeat-containing domain protein [Halteromyces radiatus]KAI8076853.1 WD40-repeat-containing domain protein [Halteromyces radiatus]
MSGAINALSLAPDGEAVVIAGREILKIITVTPDEVTEAFNLRAGSHLTVKSSSNDVKWGNNATKTKVATAATNGAIILWDINKVGRKTERVINEHSRAVNRICFQPDNGNILLSASQDGTMKCWDLRDARSRAKFRFEGKSESVRDVQFNPMIHHEFAAAFETGTIQKWDMRNPKALYDRKVSAHNGPCLTVDWHPSGRTVASGGRDKTIKVWDMSADNRRPLYTIRTMASVSRVQWRPGYDDEIASCALLTDQRIHIWDVRRPNLAKYAFDEHETTPTGFLWYNSDVLYSVAKDKFFIRQEVEGSYIPDQLLRRNAVSWNAQGDVSFAVDKSIHDEFVNTKTTKSTVSAPKKSKRLNTKLPSVEEGIQYVPLQSCGIAHLPLFDFETFSVFAENYDISGNNVADACEKNSQLGWKMGSYRTSQTWKIVGLLFEAAPLLENDHPNDNDDEHKLQEQMSRAFFNESDKDEELDTDEEDKSAIQTEEDDDDDDDDDDDEDDDEDDDDDDDDDDDEDDDKDTNASESNLLDTAGVDLFPTWQHDNVVAELFDYYTEQCDVQMCVTLYLVLQKYIHVDDDRLEAWFNAYIDLLHRFKLWSAATAIINACKIPRIQERNQMATTINIACSNCFKLVLGTNQGAWACDKCHRLLNPCSICHQTVKSLYVWCQGCNHGGHLEHMRAWFSEEKQCPTGCGHNCVLTSFDPYKNQTSSTSTWI